ncbi:uncharacterized protein CIMG_11520 [Coccidioides immitis RS]|uniref:Uncharacterized protein n=4 Tax=Coccidioides immitis TaxID=5501 RepID=A0A0D8JVL1_COCIM|nr:uncharacterized protein CIMG_11520 [Coccidioides immitis RS]KJF61144.1 hypothetical protein CIMG_11520 [Coccidioides immitis RS]KMP05484.1 hypothetical protein CIRG_05165 [Coccidioides immitis RMSCC 2394]KMU81373.1 hypothetical protein CISG_09061 [Coccidioides immitis RMSCC 3703]
MGERVTVELCDGNRPWLAITHKGVCNVLAQKRPSRVWDAVESRMNTFRDRRNALLRETSAPADFLNYVLEERLL